MRHRLLPSLLLLATLSTAALADSPEAILKDYRKQAAQAVAGINQSLEKAVVPFIDKLAQQKDDAGADELTNQYKDKLAGEPVPTPRAEVAPVFAAYDKARDSALASLKKSSLARIDGQMKTTGGAKAGAKEELAKVREEVEAGKILKELNFPSTWHCQNGPAPLAAVLTLLPDGRWRYQGMVPSAVSTSGEWVKTQTNAQYKNYKLTLKSRGQAPWTVSVSQNGGILQRPGQPVQFLRLPPKA